MTPSASSNKNSVSPAILRGKEGRMNGQIIRYLALNGPSLIYSVAKDLASRSETKVHYPTVNRRMHELMRREYIQKVGTRTTKAGIAADLYANTTRADFAALAGVPDVRSQSLIELSPKEIRQMIAVASFREGSPFVLLAHMLEEDKAAAELVDKELVPEISMAVRNGYLNLDARDDGVICSAFASLIARKVTSIIAATSRRDRSSRSKEIQRGYIVDIMMRSLEKTMVSHDRAAVGKAKEKNKDDSKRFSTFVNKLSQQNIQLMPISHQWCNELRVFLKLHSVRSE